jgi:histidinol dehydrogenase
MALAPVVEAVETILEEVRTAGDAALLAFTRKYDGAELTPETMKVTEAEIRAATQVLDDQVLADLKAAADRIRAFHEKQMEHGPTSFRMINADGGEVGMEVRPLERVGLYVPGGTAPLPSSVLMNAIPAAVAGVKSLVMCTPPRADGTVAPVIIAAARLAGVTEIYKVGGAQAVAALAYGTATVPKVDKICGPGNIYVNTAKRLVYGTCDIDLFAGPSEILVIADETAVPRYVAADLLSQAEHDPLASAILLSTSDELIREVEAEVADLFEKAGRRSILEQSLSNYAALIRVKNLQQAIDISNSIAPEHLELCIRDEDLDETITACRHVGAVFAGHFSPEPLGDYFAGPNHVLPTSGTARFFSPLNTGDFLKKISLIRFDRPALQRCARAIQNLAAFESLDCHATALRVRFEDAADDAETGGAE